MNRQQPFIPPTVVIGQGMHGVVRTLDDMSEEEIRAIERKYGMPVVPRSSELGQELADDGGHALGPCGEGVQAHEDAVPVVETEQQKAT